MGLGFKVLGKRCSVLVQGLGERARVLGQGQRVCGRRRGDGKKEDGELEFRGDGALGLGFRV